MKSKKRLTLIVLTIMAMIACLIGAVACGGGKDADVIDMYILPQNETLVDSDFSLPKTIGADGAVAVTWTSSNTNAIAIEDGGEEYTAKVTLQAEVTPVTLTIAAGKAKKDFTVRVDALNVFTFINHFTFAQEKTSVTKDFDLLTSTSFAGQSATIAWSVSDDASKSYIEVQNDNKVHIKPDYDLVDVKIDAKFTYNGDSVTQSYTFSVSPEFDPLQKVNRMYSQADYPLEISGYIVHAYEVSESYGNATMYIVSDDYTYGYYLYRAKFTGDASQYVKGAHVTYSGGTAKNYNGLWENNSNGTVSADGKPAGDIDGNVYAMDTDFLANVPSLLWRESTLVSLSGWKVTKGEKPTGADADLFTLEKNSKKITVRISKYVNRTDDELTALCNVYDSLKDGDFVDVKGILGCYKDNFQIQPILASDIKKVDAETPNEDGAKLAAAVKAVNDAVKANIGSLVAADKNFTMPTDKGGVTISYKLTPSSLPASTFTVSINGGDFSVKPTTSEKNYDIQVTYTLGGKNYYSFFKLRNWKLTAQQIVDTVESYAKKERIANITASGDVDLPDIDALGATLTWSVKGEMPTWLKISGNTATVSQLPEFESELVFVVTISLDGAQSKSYEYKAVKVSARPNVTFTALTEAKEGTYKFAMLANGTMLYATGKMDGYYYGTTNDSTKAADFVIKKVGDNQYTVTIEGKYLEIIPRTDGSKGVNIAMNDKQTEGKYWQWNDAIKNFVMESTYNNNNDPESTDVDIYYFGTSGTYTTMSGNYISRIATKGDDGTYTANGKEGVDQWVAHFGEVKKGADKTDQNKVDAAIEDVNDKYTVEVAGDWLLPTCKVNGVTFSWAIKGTSTYRLTTEKTKLIVNELPASDATVTLTVTATLDGKDTVTASKDVTVTIKAALVEAPFAAGNYNIVLRDETNHLVWYVTGVIDSKGGLTVSHDNTTVAVLTVIWENGKYTLKIGNQYLEAYLNGTYKNMRLVDTPSADAIEWKWSTEHKTFYAEYSDGTRYLGGNYYSGQVDNLYNNAVTLAEEKYFTDSNPVVIHYETPGSTGGDQPSTTGFTPLTTPQAGSYYMAMLVGSDYWYITGQMAATYYFGTVKDVSSAVQVTLVASGDNWLIKYGEKFIEISLSGTHINAVYSDTQNGTWSWNATEGVFVWNKNGTDYIIGNTGTFTNIGGIALSDKAANHFAVLGTYNGTTGGTTPGGSTGGGTGGTTDPGETEEGLLYNLDGATKGSGNSYAGSSTVTVGGITWTVMGNTQIGTGDYDVDYWRFGGKAENCTAADRKIVGQGAITGKVMRVVIEFGTMSKTAITVNSVKLNVYSSDPSAADATPIATKTVSYEKDGTVTIEADASGWTNCYFELVMNLTASGTSNTWLEVKSIKFYSTTASAAAAAATAMLPGKQTNA